MIDVVQHSKHFFTIYNLKIVLIFSLHEILRNEKLYFDHHLQAAKFQSSE